MGAVGGAVGAAIAGRPYPRNKRPEAGLLGLRKAMDVFANLRPAVCFEALAGASALKPELVAGLDLMIVRELTGGVYFGEPRGVETLPDGQKRAVDTQVYTTHEIERVSRVAFNLARGRRNKVTSCEKANVMETGALWREVVTDLHAREFADVTLEHMLADNAAMQLVRIPSQFDVIVTDNLFGDILSDEAAMLTGSIGMLPSAALSDAGKPGLYEPIHGSAPDIAGKGLANPLAAILSFEMALRWSLGRPDLADRLPARSRPPSTPAPAPATSAATSRPRQMTDAVLKAALMTPPTSPAAGRRAAGARAAEGHSASGKAARRGATVTLIRWPHPGLRAGLRTRALARPMGGRGPPEQLFRRAHHVDAGVDVHDLAGGRAAEVGDEPQHASRRRSPWRCAPSARSAPRSWHASAARPGCRPATACGRRRPRWRSRGSSAARGRGRRSGPPTPAPPWPRPSCCSWASAARRRGRSW